MSDFVKALEAKIQALRKEREQHLAAATEIESKLGVLEELLLEEGGDLDTPTPATPKKKRPGRPRGSKNRKREVTSVFLEDDVTQEAAGMEGTDPEIAKKLASRPFRPAPRPLPWSWGPGVRAGRPEDTGQGKTTIPGRDRADLSTREPEVEEDDG